MIIKSTVASALLWLGMTATVAQAATAPCLTKEDIQIVAAAVLPDTLRGLGKACTASLPATAILRDGLQPLVARFEPGSTEAWPRAIQIFASAGGVGDLKGIDPQLMRPMIGPMIATMFTDKINPADCPVADRMVTLFAPLPPENLTEILATIVELAAKDKKGADSKTSDFRMCLSAPKPALRVPSAHS